MKNSSFEKVFYCLAILLTLSVIYSPCLFIQYIFHDEMLFLIKGSGKFPLHPHFYIEISIGRPVSALLLAVYGWFIHSAKDIMITRWICLVELAGCAFFFMSLFQKFLLNKINSFLAALFIFTLPAFQVFMAWSGNVNWHTGMFLSTVSAMLLYKNALNNPDRTMKSFVNRYSLLSLFFLCLANTIYPASATFYWAVLALIILASSPDSRPRQKKIIIDFYAIGLTSLGLYAVMLKILNRIYPGGPGLYNPYHLSTDTLGKLNWFIREPLFNALNLHNIFPEKSMAMGLSVFLVVTLIVVVIQLKDKKKISIWKAGGRGFLFLGVYLSLLILSFLPNLLAVKNAAFYRCSSALAAIVAVLFIWAVSQWMIFVPSKIKTITLTGILLILFFCGAQKAFFNILDYRVIPTKVEFAYFKGILDNINLDRFSHIHLIRPEKSFVSERYDEFGILTSNNLHALAFFLSCIAEESGGKLDFGRVDLTSQFIDKDKERYAGMPEPFFRVPFVHVFLKGQETQINVSVPVNIYHGESFVIDMPSFVASFKKNHRVD